MKTHALWAIATLSLACGASDGGATGGEGGGASSGPHGTSTSSHASSSHAATTTTGGGASTTATSGGQGGQGGGTGGSSSSSSGTGGGPASTGQWVLGYYVGYMVDDYPIADIDWSGITHIAFAPMTLNADLTPYTGFDSNHGDAQGKADAIALAQAAHAHGVVPLLMLGGAQAGGRIATAAHGANRSKLVTDLLATMDALGYDGIDLDWEDSVNLDDLVSLAADLRAARASIVLSYPGGPINPNFQTADPKYAALAASLDRFNIQTYAPATVLTGQGWSSWFSSPIAGETTSTPISIHDSLERYAALGIAKNKLGFGMAFYAICYTGGITGPHQPVNGTTQQIVGGDNNYGLGKFFAANGTFANAQPSELVRDAEAEVPYLALATAKNDAGCGASTRYIPYDDETSIKAKGKFSRDNGYGGMIIWTLQEGWLPANAAGGRARNALMQALKQGFLDP